MNKSLAIISTTLICISTLAFSAEKPDTQSKETLLARYTAAMNKSQPLDKTDETLDLLKMYRDCSTIEGREPGPINIQRTIVGGPWMGIPTYLFAPVALCPQDLVAGKVDIAIMGAGLDMGMSARGTGFGPMSLRVADTTVFWGASSQVHPTVGEVDFMKELSVVDYGDAMIDPWSVERSTVSIHHMVKEIADAGTVPVVIGGDHSIMYPSVVAVTDVHGKGEIAVVHFDAHYDAGPSVFGHYLTHGSQIRRMIEEGHVKGEHVIQIGLNSPKPSLDDLTWMRKVGIKFRFMHEIEKKGWRKVTEEVVRELKDMGIKKVYLSLDVDVYDPSVAPGVGAPEPGSMTTREVFPMLRAIGVTAEIVGMDVVELNPLIDHTRQTSLVALRSLREMLTGIAMRKKGITDPFYVAPEWEKYPGKVSDK